MYKKEECGWTPNYENHNLFETGCGNEYNEVFNAFKFCPFCGNEIIKFVTPDTIWKKPCKIIVDRVTIIFGKDIVKNIYIGIRGCNGRSKLKSVEFLNDYETFLVNNIDDRDNWFFFDDARLIVEFINGNLFDLEHGDKLQREELSCIVYRDKNEI